MAYIPLDEAPPEFMKRYDAIMSGAEPIDTAAKLKDFWLFAIEQGWPHPEMREYMADLMMDVGFKYRDRFGSVDDVSTAFDYIEGCTVIWSPNEPEIDHERYDRCWSSTLHVIENIKPEEYDQSMKKG